MNFHASPTQRGKERQPLQMIHVQMSKQNVHPLKVIRQVQPQAADSRARIQHQQHPVLPFD